jgi:hypothetical protein
MFDDFLPMLQPPAIQLDASWHPETAAKDAERRIGVVEMSLNLKVGALYEACRYPDRWPGGCGLPSVLIQENHAAAVYEAVREFLLVCSDYLQFQLEAEDG